MSKRDKDPDQLIHNADANIKYPSYFYDDFFADEEYQNAEFLNQQVNGFAPTLNNDDISPMNHPEQRRKLLEIILNSDISPISGLLQPHTTNANRAIKRIIDFLSFRTGENEKDNYYTNYISMVHMRKYVEMVDKVLLEGKESVPTYSWLTHIKKDKYKFGISLREIESSLKATIQLFEYIDIELSKTALSSSLSSVKSIVIDGKNLSVTLKDYIIRYISVMLRMFPKMDFNRGDVSDYIYGDKTAKPYTISKRGTNRSEIVDMTKFFSIMGFVIMSSFICYDLVTNCLFQSAGPIMLKSKRYAIDLNHVDFNDPDFLHNKDMKKRWKSISQEIFHWRKLVNGVASMGMNVNEIPKSIFIAIGCHPGIIPIYQMYQRELRRSLLSNRIANIRSSPDEINRSKEIADNINEAINSQLKISDQLDKTLDELKKTEGLKPTFPSYTRLISIVPLYEELGTISAPGENVLIGVKQNYHNRLKIINQERSDLLKEVSKQMKEDIEKDKNKKWWEVLLMVLDNIKWVIFAIGALIFLIYFGGPVSGIINTVVSLLNALVTALVDILGSLFGSSPSE